MKKYDMFDIDQYVDSEFIKNNCEFYTKTKLLWKNIENISKRSDEIISILELEFDEIEILKLKKEQFQILINLNLMLEDQKLEKEDLEFEQYIKNDYICIWEPNNV